MSEDKIVYNRYWILECLNRLGKEKREASELHHNLLTMKQTIDPVHLKELNQIIYDVERLENSLSKTYFAIEKYMDDMEKVIDTISLKIKEADETGSKAFERDWFLF